MTIFRKFFLIFSGTVLCTGLRFFCVVFSVPKCLILAIKNNIWKYFQIFHHKGGPLRSKSYTKWKKMSKSISKKILNIGLKGKKMGGESFNITISALLDTLVQWSQYTVQKIVARPHFWTSSSQMNAKNCMLKKCIKKMCAHLQEFNYCTHNNAKV